MRSSPRYGNAVSRLVYDILPGSLVAFASGHITVDVSGESEAGIMLPLEWLDDIRMEVLRGVILRLREG